IDVPVEAVEKIPEPVKKPPRKPPRKPPAPKKAIRLRGMAETLEKQIEDKRREMTQNPTPKRMRDYYSRRHEANNLERLQKALRAMADALDAGTLPAELEGITKKADIQTLVWKGLKGGGYYEVIPDPEYRDKSPAGKILQDMIEAAETPEAAEKRAKREKFEAIKKAEEKFRFLKIKGFFPTPGPVISVMLDKADIEPGMRVLEPSAGKGDIADRIMEAGVEPDVIELRPGLQDILKLKGHNVVGDDFLEFTADSPTEKYDRIVMNPPFEKNQDQQHVRHAFDLLKPGGRLIAIMSEGSFTRSQKKDKAFQEWFENIGGESEKLTPASFKGKESFRQTGVSSRIVTIDRDGIPFARRAGRPVGAAIVSPAGRELVLLAYGADSATGYHEAYHVLRRRLTEKDRRILDKYFRGDEEAEAAAFANFVKTGKARTFLQNIWQKLKDILTRIKNQLQGLGYKTVEDLFAAIEAGTVEKQQITKGQVKYAMGEYIDPDELKEEIEKTEKKVKGAKKPKGSRFKIKINDKTPLLSNNPEWQEWSPRAGVGAFGITPIPRQDPKQTPPLSAELYPDTILDELVADPSDIKKKKDKLYFTDEWYKQNIKDYKDSRVEIFKDHVSGVAKKTFDTLDYLLGASSTRLYNIHPELFRAARRYVYNMLTRTTDQLEEIEPFLKKMKKLPKADYRRLDLALKNSDKREIDRVIEKYDLRGEYEVVRDVLNDIYAAARLVGIDMQYKSDYWHRELSDPKGFLKYFQGTEYWSIIQKALEKRAERAGRTVADLTVDEKAQVVNTLLRGFRTQALTLAAPGAGREGADRRCGIQGY
ncbi:MAG: methyltransferase domain-containing protein, partial [Planctomycetota bacterium]